MNSRSHWVKLGLILPGLAMASGCGYGPVPQPTAPGDVTLKGHQREFRLSRKLDLLMLTDGDYSFVADSRTNQGNLWLDHRERTFVRLSSELPKEAVGIYLEKLRQYPIGEYQSWSGRLAFSQGNQSSQGLGSGLPKHLEHPDWSGQPVIHLVYTAPPASRGEPDRKFHAYYLSRLGVSLFNRALPDCLVAQEGKHLHGWSECSTEPIPVAAFSPPAGYRLRDLLGEARQLVPASALTRPPEGYERLTEGTARTGEGFRALEQERWRKHNQFQCTLSYYFLESSPADNQHKDFGHSRQVEKWLPGSSGSLTGAARDGCFLWRKDKLIVEFQLMPYERHDVRQLARNRRDYQVIGQRYDYTLPRPEDPKVEQEAKVFFEALSRSWNSGRTAP